MTPRVMLFALVLQATALVDADDVFIRGGGRLTGEVVEQGPASILVDIGTGKIGLPLSHVERIVPGETPVGLYRQRAARLEPDDVTGWLALGRWARDHDLDTNAREAFENVLAADPANASAHRALGHVQLDGRWMTRDESYLARGYVRFEGAWITPEERRAAIDERRTIAEERRARAEADARIREAEARARLAEAEARRAEADLARVEAEPWQDAPAFLGGAEWTPWFAGSFFSPVVHSAFAYPAFPHRALRPHFVHGFAPRHHSCRSVGSHRPPSSVRSARGRVPHRTFRGVTPAARRAPIPGSHVPRRSAH